LRPELHHERFQNVQVQAYEARTGRLLFFTPWYHGLAYYNQYTLFFFIKFRGLTSSKRPICTKLGARAPRRLL